MQVKIVSFGFRNGPPQEASLLVDVRAIRNPHRDPALRRLTGRHAAVKAQVLGHTLADALLGHAEALIAFRAAEGRQAVTIGIGCTGGHHRSVAMADELGRRLATWAAVKVTHRDLGR